MQKKLFILILSSLLLFSPAFAAQTKSSSDVEVEWAVKVNNKIIPMEQFEKAVEFSKKQIAAQKGEGTEVSTQEENETAKMILDQMIESEIISQWAQKSDIEVTDAEITKKIAEMKKKFPSSQDFHKSLANRGMNVTDLKKAIARDLIVEKVTKIKLKEQIISDEEIRKFYDKNTDLYVQKAKVKMKQIFVGSKDKVLEVVNKIKEGVDFGEVAKQYSEDDDTKADGGDLGMVEEGNLPESYEKKVFALPPKVVSDPIKDEKGYYIFWVDEKFPRQEISFEDAKDNIRRFLLNEKARVAFLKKLEEEKKEATIILNDKLKGMFNEQEAEEEQVEGQ